MPLSPPLEAKDVYKRQVDTWLIWKLTKGKVHVTDYTNASRTMLFDIHERKWDKEILEYLDIPECMLPEVKPSSCIYGYTNENLIGGRIPIAGAAGDQPVSYTHLDVYKRQVLWSTLSVPESTLVTVFPYIRQEPSARKPKRLLQSTPDVLQEHFM